MRRRPAPVALAESRAGAGSTASGFDTHAGGLLIFSPTVVAWECAGWSAPAPFPGASLRPALNTWVAMLALNLTGQERLSPGRAVGTDPGFALFAALTP